jgi:hypothetical protein
VGDNNKVQNIRGMNLVYVAQRSRQTKLECADRMRI